MKRYRILASLLGVGLILTTAHYAMAEEEDPLVSVSYLNKRLEEVRPIGTAAAGLEVVEMEKGDRLSTAQGTQIILRSGKGRIIASERGGIADLTSGQDLGQGAKVPANHLLLVPRSDGRGLVAESHVVLLVTGSYDMGQ